MIVQYDVKVPLADGVMLAGQLKRPDEHGRHPVLISCYPYHKDGMIKTEFDYANSYFVEHGYATLLVDMRGSGGSTGDLSPATDPQEGRDGAELVEWAAGQTWCDGNVGMWGASYGGINSYKTAALNPPSLKAIAPILGSLDLYNDFIYPGGCRNMMGATAVWGPSMIAMGICPPLHQDSDGDWERRWRERLEVYEPQQLSWASHPAYDEFWESKAVRPADISIPTWAIGGWRDLFPRAVSQSYMESSGPRKLLMGPWLHTTPDDSKFEAIEYLPELVRWWDRWLKGERNGIDEEPEVRFHAQCPGRWFDAASWPPKGHTLELYLTADNLLQSEPDDAAGVTSYTGDPTVGTCAGIADPHGGSGLPIEQADDLLRSLAFTASPVAEETLIAGSPRAFVDVVVEDGVDANLVVKLIDVGPDGRSALITTGWLNLRRPNGAVDDRIVDTSIRTCVPVELLATGYLLPAGHRLRVAISTSDYPRIWPTPTNPTLQIHWGTAESSRIEIPIATDVEPATPVDAEQDESRFVLFHQYTPRWEVTRDHINDRVTVVTGSYFHIDTPSRSGEFTQDHSASVSVAADRPDGAVARGETKITAILANGRRVEVEAGSLTSHNTIDAHGSVTLDGQQVFFRRWSTPASPRLGREG